MEGKKHISAEEKLACSADPWQPTAPSRSISAVVAADASFACGAGVEASAASGPTQFHLSVSGEGWERREVGGWQGDLV